jgi:hypothetical protein
MRGGDRADGGLQNVACTTAALNRALALAAE